MPFTHTKFTNDLFKVVLHLFFYFYVTFYVPVLSFSISSSFIITKPPFIIAYFHSSLHILCITSSKKKPCSMRDAMLHRHRVFTRLIGRCLSFFYRRTLCLKRHLGYR